MPIKVTCSNCGGVLHAPDDAGGKKGRCPTCGTVLIISADAPRANTGHGAHVPEAPPPNPKTRSQSFGDFGMPGASSAAPQPAPRAAAEPPAPRASAPSLTETSAPEARRPAKLPPPAFEKPEKRKASEPVAKGKAKLPPVGAPAPEVGEGQIKGWKKARSGLWWVRSGIPFLWLAAASLPTLAIVQHFTGPLPFIKPEGFFGIKGYSGQAELALALVGVPLVIGLGFFLLGRLGFSGAPSRARSKGLAMFSALATLTCLAGVVAIVMPPAAALIMGDSNLEVPKFFDTSDTEEYSGFIQRGGLVFLLGGILLAEFWFASSVGRVGAALNDGRTAARSTRYLFVLGLVFLFFLFAGMGATKPGSEKVVVNDYWLRGPFIEFNNFVEKSWNKYGQPHLNELKEFKYVALNGIGVFFTLVVAFGYLRMVGAARCAIREFVDHHGGVE